MYRFYILREHHTQVLHAYLSELAEHLQALPWARGRSKQKLWPRTHTTRQASCGCTSEPNALAHTESGLTSFVLWCIGLRKTNAWQRTMTLDHQRKTSWTWTWPLTVRISPISRWVSAQALGTYLCKSLEVLGKITNETCASTAQSWLAENGALELNEVCRWRSMHRHCLVSRTGRWWYCFHDCKSFLKVRQLVLCSLPTHSFCLFVCLTPPPPPHTHTHSPFGCFLVSCGWLPYWSRVAPTLFWRMRGTLIEWFFGYHYFGAGAWHVRLEQAQTSMRKDHGDSVQAKSVPRQGLANMPRQGIGKRSQAETGKASQAGTRKHAQEGNWQTFPCGELAKHSRQGLATVPRQGTGKCYQAGNHRRSQAWDSGCSQAGNCRHCTAQKKFSNDLPPAPKVPPHRQPAAGCVMRVLACLRDGDEGLVNTALLTTRLQLSHRILASVVNNAYVNFFHGSPRMFGVFPNFSKLFSSPFLFLVLPWIKTSPGGESAGWGSTSISTCAVSAWSLTSLRMLHLGFVQASYRFNWPLTPRDVYGFEKCMQMVARLCGLVRKQFCAIWSSWRLEDKSVCHGMPARFHTPRASRS